METGQSPLKRAIFIAVNQRSLSAPQDCIENMGLRFELLTWPRGPSAWREVVKIGALAEFTKKDRKT